MWLPFQGNVMDMVQDIADCILWSRETGHTFNIDKRNIVLIGHSAGAHLCALTALFLAAESEEMGIELSKQRDILTSVKGVVGLSGVYHIMNHYQYETWRGVEYVSTMHKAMGGIENFEHYSPTLFVKTLTEDKLAKLPPFTLIHGTKDTIVPVESTLQFSEALTAAAVKASLFLLPHVGHTELVTDLMGSNRRYYHTILGCIKQGINKVTAHG
ncbi:putative isoprenylcysteine alpha-carbonyl methylesterase ICMEL2 isoform X1 [Huso huso]|uniref:Isoprenylcysteine alpha-carbonyl methylesterase ICMEL2 isoform X1 n=1 Tax=Huso huso TaxID=61971 RepID=A0ABR0Y0Z0_HUSHU